MNPLLGSHPTRLVVASFGAGTNSTGEICRAVELGWPIDLIPFADTGGEKPHTYEHIRRFSAWLVARGYPPVTTISGHLPQQRKDGSLEAECIRLGTMPSKVYGYGSCSMKWKLDPTEHFIRKWPPAIEAWSRGEPIEYWIGFDADEPHRAERRQKARANDKRYAHRFPLIEWGYGRDECIGAIARAGLPLPGKSACFFCPSSKKPEVAALRRDYPELYARAIEMERKALTDDEGEGNRTPLLRIKGLGRQWAWKDIDTAPDNCAIEPDCGCYDGG
jgi:hypothetical protein